MNLPSIRKARLPDKYIAARVALAECSKIDECHDWANKSDAMASYAKQSQDKTLEKMAVRIKARAIRRCGELLKQIEPSPGGRPLKGSSKKTRVGARPSLSRKQAASDAGMSEHQRKAAIRVANVPEEEFEAAVESDDPPTITGLSQSVQDKMSRNSAVPGFAQATKAIGTVSRMAEFCEANDPVFVAGAYQPHEKPDLIANIETSIKWLGVFKKALKGKA